jgi:hypothetical protein
LKDYLQGNASRRKWIAQRKDTGREIEFENDAFIRVSSYNQLLFIGDTDPQPGYIYVKFHEMLAKMRGQAQYYEMDSYDEYNSVQCTENLFKYK